MPKTGVTYRLVRPPVRAGRRRRRSIRRSKRSSTTPTGRCSSWPGPAPARRRRWSRRSSQRVDEGASPDQVLVLTFSRKAAEELRSRITARLGRTVREPAASTFHGFCYSLLRTYGVAPGGSAAAAVVRRGARDASARAAARQREGRRQDPLAGRARAGARACAASPRRSAICSTVPASAVSTAIGCASSASSTTQPMWVAAGDFMDEYLDVLEARDEVDYADLVSRAAALLDGPARRGPRPVPRGVRR